MTTPSSIPLAATLPTYAVSWASTPAHESLIVDLWRECGLGGNATSENNLARLRWFYLDNPQGLAQLNLLGFGPEGVPVGFLAVAPRVFFVGGDEFVAGTLVDFVVNPKHRSAYPALALQRAGRERALKSWEFVYGLPDTKAVAICKRLTTHVSFQLPRFVRIVRSGAYLSRVMPPLLANVLSWFVDATDAVVTSLRLSLSELRGEWVDQFDSSFDSLWSRLEKRTLCIGLRNRVFLKWRFSAQPQHKYQIFAVKRSATRELCMYFVCERSGKGLVVKDCLSAGSETELRDGLLLLSKQARKLGATSVDLQIYADSMWERALKRTQFALRSSRPFFAAFREPLQQKVEGCQWYITQADEDI